jgi:hypothetical protein
MFFAQRKGENFFALFSVGVGAVHDPPTFGRGILWIKVAGPGRQPGDFLCWSKESHQRKDLVALRSACLLRFSELSMVVTETIQGDLLNAGRRGPMDSAPCECRP